MSFSVVAHVSVQAVGQLTTAAINTTGADLIVFCINVFTGDTNPPAITDSAGNAWGTAAVTNTFTGRQSGYIYFKQSPTTSASHTFGTTAGGGNTSGTCAILAVSGSATTPLDQTNSNTYGPGTTSEPTGSVNPVQNSELVVGYWGIDDPAGSTFAVSGYTIDEHLDVVVGSIFGGVLAHNIQTTATVTNPTLTRSAINASRGDVALVATFKAAGGTPAGSQNPYTPWPQLGPILAS